MINPVLADIWFLLLALELGLFVALDGADLGIGVLSLFVRDQKHRSMMMASIGPVWDANETWLVIAGGTLFGAFPLVYSLALDALYMPIMLMIFGFIFRAVALEFRMHSQKKRFWDIAFGAGSLAAILGQGLAFGGLMSGLKVQDGIFAGGHWDWFNGMSILVAVGVASGYSMMGSSYLIMKTDGKLRERSQSYLIIVSCISFILLVTTTLMFYFLHEPILQKWSSGSQKFYLLALVAMEALVFFMLLKSAFRKKDNRTSHFWSNAVFIITYITLFVWSYPYIIPSTITAKEAAASGSTLTFMIFGVGILIPVILVYNVYVRRVFKGKVNLYGDDIY
jgi:cytochrome d ubiquinol oxidase subunit II